MSNKKRSDTKHIKKNPTVPVSVITTCYGRNRHLYNLLTSLEAGTVKPAEIIIVNDDADKQILDSFDLTIIQIATVQQSEEDIETISTTGFDIGRNRNVGAKHASYESLVFLDVDCIVASDFIDGITTKLDDHPTALLMGQPYYLTRPLNDEEVHQLKWLDKDNEPNNSWLQALAIVNPYRHNLDDSTAILHTQDYGGFWSLCFAVTKKQFYRIGGFDTHYVGYGAEDTDFSFMARSLGIDFYLTNDKVYHQQHSVSRPPLNHLASIAINANRFFEKWQHWPMSGWLETFATMGLIDWENSRNKPITIKRMPKPIEIENAYSPDAPFV